MLDCNALFVIEGYLDESHLCFFILRLVDIPHGISPVCLNIGVGARKRCSRYSRQLAVLLGTILGGPIRQGSFGATVVFRMIACDSDAECKRNGKPPSRPHLWQCRRPQIASTFPIQFQLCAGPGHECQLSEQSQQ